MLVRGFAFGRGGRGWQSLVPLVAPQVRRQHARRNPTAGLTLVELMVTLVVAAMVTSSTFVFFAGQRRIYDTQMKILNAQQNLWAALEMVTRNARVAGMGMIGCVKQDPDGAGAELADPPPITNAAGKAPQTGLRVMRNTLYTGATPAGYEAAGTPFRLAPLWIGDGGDGGGPDSMVVVYGTGSFGNFADAGLAFAVSNANWALDFTVQPTFGTIFNFPGEFGVLIDRRAPPTPGPPPGDRGCTMFQVSGRVGDTIQHGLTAGPATFVWNSVVNNPPAGLLPTATWSYPVDPDGGIRDFGQLNWWRFFVQAAAGGDCVAPPCLMVEDLANLPAATTAAPAQLLAEGIEDMQIAFGCDVQPAGVAPAPDGDGVLTEDGTPNDEWIYNNNGDVTAGVPVNVAMQRCNQPTAIRITLMARSTEPDVTLEGQSTNRKPAAENGTQGAVDMFRHKQMTTVVYPRNR